MEGFTLGQPYGYGLTEQTTLTGTPPAAGASFSSTVAKYDRHRLVFVTFALTTDANAANRYVTVEYVGGDGVSVCADAASVLVTANTTAQRFVGQLHRGPAEWNTGSDVFFPLAGIWLESGTKVNINVANMQVGDTLTNIRLTYDRYLAESQRPFPKRALELYEAAALVVGAKQ